MLDVTLPVLLPHALRPSARMLSARLALVREAPSTRCCLAMTSSSEVSISALRQAFTGLCHFTGAIVSYHPFSPDTKLLKFQLVAPGSASPSSAARIDVQLKGAWASEVQFAVGLTLTLSSKHGEIQLVGQKSLRTIVYSTGLCGTRNDTSPVTKFNISAGQSHLISPRPSRCSSPPRAVSVQNETDARCRQEEAASQVENGRVGRPHLRDGARSLHETPSRCSRTSRDERQALQVDRRLVGDRARRCYYDETDDAEERGTGAEDELLAARHGHRHGTSSASARAVLLMRLLV